MANAAQIVAAFRDVAATKSLSDEEMTAWIERARDHIATLPPKAKKPRK